jgi:hypothetical protein
MVSYLAQASSAFAPVLCHLSPASTAHLIRRISRVKRALSQLLSAMGSPNIYSHLR